MTTKAALLLACSTVLLAASGAEWLSDEEAKRLLDPGFSR